MIDCPVFLNSFLSKFKNKELVNEARAHHEFQMEALEAPDENEGI